jgi:hypothetical protein
MKKWLLIAGAIGLMAVGASLTVVLSAPSRESIQGLVLTDVLGGSNTFCVGIIRTGRPIRLRVETPDPGGADAVVPKIDALVRAGILERGRVKSDAAKPRAEGHDYVLTDFGWEQLDFDDEGCIVAGTFDVAIRRITVISRSWLFPEIVNAEVGVTTTVEKLAPWAKDPSINRDLPEIGNVLRGVAINVKLIQKEGRWDVLPLAEFESPLRVPESAALPLDDGEKTLLAKHPPPDKGDVTKMWQNETRFWSGAYACVDIAGSEAFPVDERLVAAIDDRLKRDSFGVAIYEMLERDAPQQKVLDLTLPRLETLERAGVLISSSTTGPKFRARMPGRLYVLAPAYEQFWNDEMAGGCLLAGTAKMEVTALKFRGLLGKFIARHRYTQVETWARSPEVLEKLPDVGRVIEEGVVSYGELRLEASGWAI